MGITLILAQELRNQRTQSNCAKKEPGKETSVQHPPSQPPHSSKHLRGHHTQGGDSELGLTRGDQIGIRDRNVTHIRWLGGNQCRYVNSSLESGGDRME